MDKAWLRLWLEHYLTEKDSFLRVYVVSCITSGSQEAIQIKS